MKQFKRIMTLLLAFAMSLCMTLPVGAAVPASVSAGAVTAKAGEDAAVELSIANNPGFAFLKIELSYDTDKMTFSNARSNFGMNFETYTLSSGKVNLLWDKSSNATGDGVICVLNFAVKSGATGTADVSLLFVEANDWDLNSFVDPNNLGPDNELKPDDLQMTVSGGSVTIGDADSGSGSGSGTGSEGGSGNEGGSGAGSGSGNEGGSGSGSGSGSGGGAAADTTQRAITAHALGGGTIRPGVSAAKAGDYVTITVTPESGRQISALAVTTASGKLVSVTQISDTEFVFAMPAEAIAINAVFEQSESGGTDAWPYKDVSKSNWYYDAVAYVTARGLMNGMAADLFAPNTETTRAMVMTILARLSGADVSGASPWYAKAVEWAMQYGVSDGTNPGANITREQLVTMLYRYAQLRNLSVEKTGSLAAYPDAGSVHEYARPAMEWAVGSGLVNGINGKLEPRGNSTRAQIATLLMRFCETYKI